MNIRQSLCFRCWHWNVFPHIPKLWRNDKVVRQRRTHATSRHSFINTVWYNILYQTSHYQILNKHTIIDMFWSEWFSHRILHPRLCLRWNIAPRNPFSQIKSALLFCITYNSWNFVVFMFIYRKHYIFWQIVYTGFLYLKTSVRFRTIISSAICFIDNIF